MSASKPKKMSAKELDEAFDSDEDVLEHFDVKSAKARYPTQRLSIDFPKQILDELDEESARIGVTRTSLIKMWVSERLADRG